MFNTLIKERRDDLQLTQQQVADELHVTRQTVSNWEKGKNFPDIPTLILMSDYYDLSLDYLLKGDERYMNEVKKDYALLAKSKKQKKVDHILICILLLLLALTVSSSFFDSPDTNSLFTFGLLLLITLLITFSFYKYRSFYDPNDSTEQGLFIPKYFGMGLTVNPNHPVGKYLWFVIIAIVSIATLVSFSQLF